MSGTLALASAVAGMDRAELDRLVRSRRVQSPAAVLDPIGLATELLRPESVARTLSRLDRSSLAALLDADRAAPSTLDALAALGLFGHDERSSEAQHGDRVPLPEVEAVLHDALAAAGIDPAEMQRSEDRISGSNVDPSLASDPAVSWFATGLTAVAQAAECLRVLGERPGRLNRNGTVAVATVRALAEATRIDADQTARTLTALDRAGLISTVAAEAVLVPSADSAAWLLSPSAARWLTLAESTLDAMSRELRTTLLHGDPSDLAAAADTLPHRFPLLPDAEFTAARSFALDAEHLGLTVRGRLSEAARQLLAGDLVAASAHVDDVFPPPSPGVYVQPDLSVVVPGPLSPDDESVLASLTAPEHVGVASTRRVTEASVSAGLERGLSAPEARAAFERLSLTGIPQPLDYLLSSLAERLGNIVVEEHHGDDSRTRITVARPELAETLLVDRALQHLQLRRAASTSTSTSTTLLSRLRIDHVLAALADARYPATARRPAPSDGAPGSAAPVNAASAATASTTRPPSNPGTAPDAQAHDLLTALVDRVFTAARSEPGSGDFTRRLELAIRDRSPVRVTAEARGESRTFTLLPVSVNAGRLRASDQAAGVERTLPINTITAVDPV